MILILGILILRKLESDLNILKRRIQFCELSFSLSKIYQIYST